MDEYVFVHCVVLCLCDAQLRELAALMHVVACLTTWVTSQGLKRPGGLLPPGTWVAVLLGMVMHCSGCLARRIRLVA